MSETLAPAPAGEQLLPPGLGPDTLPLGPDSLPDIHELALHLSSSGSPSTSSHQAISSSRESSPECSEPVPQQQPAPLALGAPAAAEVEEELPRRRAAASKVRSIGASATYARVASPLCLLCASPTRDRMGCALGTHFHIFLFGTASATFAAWHALQQCCCYI